MEEQKKKCPYCAEEIHIDAIKCKHCREMLDGNLKSQSDKKNSSNPFSENKRNLLNICSIGIIISFFLPWFSDGLFKASGFDIPNYLDKISLFSNILSAVTSVKTEGSGIQLYKLSYLLYLIPIISLYSLYNDFRSSKMRKALNEYSISLVFLIVIYIILVVNKLNFQFEIALYITLLLSVIGCVIFFKDIDI